MENPDHSSLHGDDNRIGVGASRADENEESKEENEVPNSAVADAAHAPENNLHRVEMSEVPEAARKWYQQPSFWVVSIVTCILLAVINALAVVLTRPPPMAPEQIACNFISLTNLAACRQRTHARTYSNEAETIPSEIGVLTQLTELIFGGSRGSIPSEIGLLTKLTNLVFDHTDVTGTIPTEVGRLARLRLVLIEGNHLFTGTIPSEIGLLTQLTWLTFNFNELVTGKIPSEIGHLTQLTLLEFNSNQLTGMIPSEIGHLTQLTWMKLNSNHLTGRIPSEIGHLTQLTWMELNSNQLTGRMPSEIGLMEQLIILELSSNQLTGRIPSEIRSLHRYDYNINYFWFNEWVIFGNQLTGAIPQSLCSREGYIVVDCGEVNCTNCRICHCAPWNGSSF